MTTLALAVLLASPSFATAVLPTSKSGLIHVYDRTASNAPTHSVRLVDAVQPAGVGQPELRVLSGFPLSGGSLLVAAETEPALADDAAQSCSVNSFTAATPVLLANGTEIPISNVKVGDKVLATDPQTNQTGSRPVTKLIVHSGEHTMVDVTLADGSNLTATDHHPFWDATTTSFTYADALRTGDQLREANGGLLTITNIVVFDENVTAYNLTVNGIHTYYAGTTPVLVHNSCADPALDSEGEAHVRANHFPGGEGVDSTKGVFNATEDPYALAEGSSQVEPNGPNEFGNYERVVNAGRVIGNVSEVQGGLPTTFYMVAQDIWGGVQTMFPVAAP